MARHFLSSRAERVQRVVEGQAATSNVSGIARVNRRDARLSLDYALHALRSG